MSRIHPIKLVNVRKHLPKRSAKQNKTHGGHALIVAGSTKYVGAAILSAQAAARLGAGYVTVAAANFKMLRSCLVAHPDFLATEFDPGLVRSVFTQGYSAIAIGPGLGKSPAVRQRVWRLINKLKQARSSDSIPVVIDADALNSVAQYFRTIDGPFPSTWIMTPHEGELARLLKIPSRRIHLNRMKSVRMAQEKFGCTVILKGDQTLVATGSRTWINTTGNSALAKAGTGDVLTGIIVGLLAQQVPPVESAKLGVYLHGLLADRWIKSGNDHLSLMASDLILRLPKDLLWLRKH